jgi:hypothetical protein
VKFAVGFVVARGVRATGTSENLYRRLIAAGAACRAVAMAASLVPQPRDFQSNPKRFFTPRATVLRSYRAMAAGRLANTSSSERNARSARTRGWTGASSSRRPRRGDMRARTARRALFLSVFLVFLAGALFIGCRKIVGPILREAAAQTSETHRKGDIVFTMPDGAFCRHLAFDNKTAELRESTVVQCQEARPRGSAHPPRGFAWGAR